MQDRSSDSIRPDANGTKVERRRVHFAGRVQGVGFRYTTVSVARRYAVSGYVQNLSDGRVVLVAEGAGVELDRFLADLGETMREYIRDSHCESGPPTGEFRGFQVRY
jgi:acylphosphatase